MQNQRRVLIENVLPQLDNGAFDIKRIVNQTVQVSADVLADGHDVLACSLLFKHENDSKWTEIRMNESSNDEYISQFVVEKQGRYTYFVEGWIDYALNWQHGIEKKIIDNQNVKSELLEGAELLKPLLKKVNADEKNTLPS